MRHNPRNLSVDQLDQLLARGRLSGPQRDRILDAVLSQTRNPLWFLHRLLGSVQDLAQAHRWLLAASVAAIVALVAGVWTQSQAPEPVSEWASRGAVGALNEPQVEAACLDGACKRGSLLVLRVQHVPQAASVAAYAVGPGGQRIWYFPTNAGVMPQVQPAQTTPLRQGVHLGPEHVAGAYELHMVFLRAPLPRGEILKVESAPHPDVVVGQAVRKFEIVP